VSAIPEAWFLLFYNLPLDALRGLAYYLKSLWRKETRRSPKILCELPSSFLSFSIVLTIVALLSVPALLRWIKLDPATDPTTYRAAYVYIMVIYGGLICQVFYNQICSVLRSVGDSLTPLLFLILSSILNIGLDFAFIF
jgi:Na+-driven multidrug efflux pump